MRLRRAESEIQALLNAAVDAVIVIDHRGIIDTFNHAAEKLFGYEAPEIIGKSVNNLMTALDSHQHDQYIANYETTGEPKVIGRGREIVAKRRDNTEFPAILAVGEIKNSSPRRYVGFIHDITLRNQALQSLQRSEAQLKSAQSLAHLGNYEFEYASGPSYWSEQMYTLLGLTGTQPAYTLDQFIDQCVETPDQPLVRAKFGCTESISNYLDLEFRIKRPNGVVRTVHARTLRTIGTGGKDVVSGTLHDITDRKTAEDNARANQEKLAQVSRLSTMGEMATGLAHEINQPLTAIAAYAQALLRMLDRPEGLDIEEIRDPLQQISTQAMRAGEVIRRLRNFIKNHINRTERVSLNALINEIRILASTDSNANDVTIKINQDPGISDVMVDPVQIQQVILNLIRNAIDATVEANPAQREISINTSQHADPDNVLVEVVDHGTGIADTQRQQIFEAFFTTKAQGTGLGLSISRSIINAHSGTLDFHSVPGAGTVFFFTLPATKESIS